ncbi:FKBP-type peptidyl-prolyl cis-trans isomerase N-terminal domain-containing protein [Noviluteimonas gilva]|uniref:Peptidyl-prolyl cis-trans isomerase n=1 Tax=Noviluteimonas gilva TaxID=2682097 RepID=A0A7C9HN49_9GAMM|nr:FKBP-type peptidyl-prolyl cis-trans isomerase [Lysobacter gilvus]MUV14992.1 FKBP-type peptidyl-prolyl cis-trans isomerase [Lysobacter gilvus]
MKGFVRGIAVLLTLFALSAHAQDKTKLLTERDKASYMVGMDIAESNAPIGPDVDIAAFERAMRNAMAGKPPLIDDATARKTSEVLMARIGARNQPGAKLPEISKVDVGLLAGVEWGRRLAPIQDQVDMPVVMQAIRTAFSGGKPLLSAEEATIVRQEFDTKLNALAVSRAQQGADGNLKKGEEFLAKNKLQKGVFTTRSGLQYMILRQGAGMRPKPGERVTVLYRGTLLDGTEFDSTQDNQPRTFALSQVIAGWSEGLSMMPVGGKYRFWIPGDLAYGSSGMPDGHIGPNATLVFDVELLGVE